MAAYEITPGIVSDTEILGGKPTIKGHRIAALQIMGHLAAGDSAEAMMDEYGLTIEELQAVLRYARFMATKPQGVPGKDLLEFVGTIDAADLDLISQAIEEGCEQIDAAEW